MHHLSTDKKLIAMREIFRVLTTGGKFFIADFGKQKNLIFALVGNIAAKFEPEVGTEFKGLLPDLMTNAGFKNVQTLKNYNTKVGTICIYSGEKTGNVSIEFIHSDPVPSYNRYLYVLCFYSSNVLANTSGIIRTCADASIYTLR